MPRLRPAPGALARILAAVPPASGAVVMGTGIVSVALALDGHETLSRILLVLALAAWLALAVLLGARAARDHRRFRRDVRSPAALTAVAGTAVLGTRLALLGADWAAGALLVIALAIWVGLLPQVLRHWQVPTVGVSFMLTVSTESLAVLAAALALGEYSRWLLAVSLVPFCLGLAFYLLVLSHFDRRQLLVAHGDHWVTGGALAISTVAAGQITSATEGLDILGSIHGLLKGVSLALWVLTMLWLPILLVAEALRPRLRYDVRRWSTVFPVGMYAACSFVVGAVTSTPAIGDFARVWVWVALAVWAVVSAAPVRRAAGVVRG